MPEAKRKSKPRPAPKKAETARSTPVCQVGFCPICMAVTTLGEVKPELLEHLLIAGREMLLAIRAAIDSRLEAEEKSQNKLQRLDIG